ncbi:MAG: hypothetical protein JW709_07265 [Sedimentisphaerales bacterium]|nr:hypothetical protein [Sedimentisphaerales bacterium]
MKDFSVVCVASALRQKALEKGLTSMGLAFHCIRRDAFSGLAEVLLRLRRGGAVLAIFEADHLGRDEITVFSVLAARQDVQTVAWFPAGRREKSDQVLSLGAHQAVTDLADIKLPQWRQTKPDEQMEEVLLSPKEDTFSASSPEPMLSKRNSSAELKPAATPPLRTPPAPMPPAQAGPGLEGVRLTLDKRSENDKAAAELVEDSVKNSLARLRGENPGGNEDQNHDPAIKSLSLLQELARRYRPMRVRPGRSEDAVSPPTASPTTPMPARQADNSLSQDELDTLLGSKNPDD